MRINRDRFVRSLTTRDARSLQSDREMNWNEEWEIWAKEERERKRKKKREKDGDEMNTQMGARFAFCSSFSLSSNSNSHSSLWVVNKTIELERAESSLTYKHTHNKWEWKKRSRLFCSYEKTRTLFCILRPTNSHCVSSCERALLVSFSAFSVFSIWKRFFLYLQTNLKHDQSSAALANNHAKSTILLVKTTT